MGKLISIIVLGALTFFGLKSLFGSFKTPGYRDITIQEIDSLGTEGLEFVNISGGLTGGDYIYNQFENSKNVIGITYPLINMVNMKSTLDTSKFRAKVIIEDAKADSVSFGIPTIKGKVKSSKLSSSELALMKESYDLDDDYIIVEKDWEKPTMTFGLLMTFIPGILLLMNLRIFLKK